MDSNKISVCSTCMNRMSFLEQTLPTWAACGLDDIIIVDWSSIESVTNIQAKVVRIDGETLFYPTKARNLGAGYCFREYILFIDSDIKINNLDGIELSGNSFYCGCPVSCQTRHGKKSGVIMKIGE